VGRDMTGRRQIEDTLRFVAQRGWVDDAESLLGALARYLGETLAMDYVIIDRLTEDSDIAETAALYAKGQIVPNMRYSLAGTPCEKVAGRTMCSYRENVQALFPDDILLVEMGAESYAGVPLWDSAGKPIGLIAVLDGKPFADEEQLLRILQLVATRAAAELERERAESVLRRREQQYRALADNSPDIILRYDREGRKLYANASYRSRFCVSDETLIGQTALETVDIIPPGGPLLHDTVVQVVASGRDASIELSWREADGRLSFGHVRVVPEFGDGEGVVSALAIARDISDLKETERQLIDSRSQLRELAARREDARENERRRIASDLHEELGQVLTALRMNISMLPLEFGAVLPAMEGRTEEMLRLVDGALQGLRNTVMMLRPTALDAGITVGLEWLTREFGANTGIRCVLHLPPEAPSLADARATTVFRIAQEALTNVARHAGATRAEILLERQGNQWSLKVKDDGKGFDPGQVHDRAFGLRSMSERALSLGGEFDIATAAGQGTTVILRFCQ
ncbi:MAG TPA: PAS domain S-box protein, partial [Rhodocyclaceae bacterium]|nr:PAS domain S-box protein [Rhodocyclaceae bacterium]